jgi:hypothetical protein
VVLGNLSKRVGKWVQLRSDCTLYNLWNLWNTSKVRVKFPIRGWERGHMTGYQFKDMDSLIVGCFFIMQCTCLYMHNTCSSTEDSYTSIATNYGFVLSLNVCKNMQCNRINCHHQLLLNSAVELHTRSSHLEQGTPQVEAHALSSCLRQRLHISGVPCSTGLSWR